MTLYGPTFAIGLAGVALAAALSLVFLARVAGPWCDRVIERLTNPNGGGE